MKDIKRKISWL